MREALSQLRDFVESEYESKLSVQLQTHLGELSNWNNPIWEWHDEHLSPSRDSDSATGAIIADPEIGLCLLVQAYSQRIDASAQIRKALQYRSDLLPARNTDSHLKDEYGDWRVALHWLVNSKDEPSWIEQISSLRQETAFFEEIPVDAILSVDSDWGTAIADHGLPRLLLNLRQTIRRESIDESMQWASADTRIEEYIRAIPDQTTSEHERRFADRMIQELDRLNSLNTSHDSDASPTDEPVHLQSLRIEHFRNIGGLELELGSRAVPVSSHVFQGPNGSGKSAIVEAISLSTTGISNRFLEYLNDPNAPRRAGMEDYVGSYLRPLGADEFSFPRLAFNGAESAPIESPASEDMEGLEQKLRCSVFSQLGRADFLARNPSQLGREVAQSFSSVSSRLFNFVNVENNKADEKRKKFNRSWNIQPTIKKIATAQCRILDKIIEKNIRPPLGLDDWMGASIHSHVPAFEPIANLSVSWQDFRTQYQNELERAGRRETVDGENFLTKIRDKHQVLIDKTRSVLEQFRRTVDVPPQGFSELVDRYSGWLSTSNETDLLTSSGVEAISQELDVAAKEVAILDERRAHILGRQSHLRDTLELLKRYRIPEHEESCPTCETDLSERGGVVRVIEAHLASSESDLAKLENTRKATRDRVDQLSKTKASAERAALPISNDELAVMRNFIQSVLGFTPSIDELLGDDEQSRLIKWSIDVLSSMPKIEDIENLSVPHDWLNVALAEYSDALEEFRRVSVAPDSWNALQSRLGQAHADAVKEHLPITVQALWRELALNLTSAPWQYPARAEMRVSTAKGATQARITMEGSESLAAHILNGAEVFNLSLAWFLTKYLTTGRFQFSFMVLDDPAQQMDQPTFRDLCRLLESLMRLHRRYKSPLTVLTFLHQDSRALDAARATDGILHLLRWNRSGTALLEESMRMHQEDFAPSYPEQLLGFG